MNRTLLLILCDFLLLNLLALTRWEKAEPAQGRRPPVPEVAANAASRDDDLVAAMQLALADERAARSALGERLESTAAALAEREQNLARLEAEAARLGGTLAATRATAEQLTQQVAVATEAAAMSKEELARLQRELEEKRAEARRQQEAIVALEAEQAAARERIEGLSVAVKVAEQEKLMLRETAEVFKQQAEAERVEREKVQATTVQLAQGVGQLAERSGELTRELRDHRPINVNVLFGDFLANRVSTTFTAFRRSMLGPVTRTREARTVFITDGTQVYALLHLDDTPFSLRESGADWEQLRVEFTKGAYRSSVARVDFLSLDPRVVVLPVAAEQVAALGVKVYDTALEPFKFPEAVLISGGGAGYGEVAFRLDAAMPGYVRVDNRLLTRLFGDFAPSRGDLVFSKSGELLGIMVSGDYCVLVNNVLPARSILTGDDLKGQATGRILDEMAARYRALPPRLQ
ncbi:MAG: hypothetical protein KIT44_13250 [Opitutaceae bacterium]|nr:hypothetical protein [Opitutaceae bacterium]